MATIQYDDILLNIGSRADSSGIDASIRMLGQLNDIFPIDGLGDSAQQMKAFADALNSMDKGVVTALSKIKGNLTKVASAAKSATTEIAKAQKADAPKLNADKKEIKDFFDAFGQFSISEMKGFGYDPDAVREVKTELKAAKNEADKLAKAEEQAKAEAKEFAQFTAQMEKSMAVAERELARQAANEAKAREKSAKEARAQALADVKASEMRERLGESSAPRSDIADAVQREMERLRSIREGGNYTPPEAYTDPAKIAQENAEATKALEQINQSVSDGADEAQRFDENVKQLVEDLRNAPPTTNSFLKLQGYSTQEIVAAKQEIANIKFEERQAAQEAKERAKAEAVAAKEAEKAQQALKDVGKEAEKAKTPLQNIADRFGNLIKYRIMRAIITGVVNAVKEGFKNLEEWDRAVGNTGFADAMDRAKESLLVLKNSLAVMSAPFLEWMISLLEKAARWVMNVANGISRLIAILSGKSTYRAVQWAEYGSQAATGFSHATEEAKEFKRQLMGFDEINNLTAPGSGGGGGGGGSGGGFSFGDMFTETDVGELSKFEEWLQKAGEKWREGCDNLKERFGNAWVYLKGKIKNLKDKWGEFAKKIKELKKVDWTKWWDNFVGNKKRSTMEKFLTWMLLSFSTVFKAIGLAMKGDFEGAAKVIEDGAEEIRKVLFDKTDDIVGKSKGAFDEVHETAKKRLTSIDDEARKKFESVAAKAFWLGDQVKDALSKKLKIAIDSGDITKAVDNAYKLKNDLTTITAPKWHVSIEGTLEINEIDISGLGSSYFQITKFANGGYPTPGQLFIANEAGAEMVGSVSGRTAVATNQDIVAAVSQGVASAVASVLGGGTNVNVILEGDANKLFRVVQSQARNYAIQTGSYAFG